MTTDTKTNDQTTKNYGKNNMSQNMTLYNLSFRFKAETFLQKIIKLFPETIVSYDNYMKDNLPQIIQSKILQQILENICPPSERKHKITMLLGNNCGGIVRNSFEVQEFVSYMRDFMNDHISRDEYEQIKSLLDLVM